MNPKPIFNLFSPKGKPQAVVQRGVSTLIVSLSLVVLTASMQVIQADEPVASGQPSIVALPNIDPADRKFFTPGYGVNAGGNDLTAYHRSEWDRTPNTELGAVENALAVYHQSEWGRSPNTVLGVEAPSKIDPADRKFFNPGYGNQTTNANGSEAILPSIENEMGE